MTGIRPQHRLHDLTGQRFGSLVAVEPIEPPAGRTGGGWWRLTCDCGGELVAMATVIVSGRVASSCRSCRADRRGMHVGVIDPLDPSYKAVHTRLRKARGPAKDHVCPCGAQAFDWAYDHTDPEERHRLVKIAGREYEMTYSQKLEHYRPLCRKCHRRLDGFGSAIETVAA